MRIKDVIGFEGLYVVSDHGHVIRLYRVWRDKHGRLNMRPTRVLVSPGDERGYKQVRLFAPDRPMLRLHIHRLVAGLFVPPYDGEVVNHIDGNPRNNHHSNLEWTTTAGNLMHGQLRRSKTPLTATEILELRALHGTVPLETLALRYNKDKATIQRAIWGYKRKPRG